MRSRPWTVASAEAQRAIECLAHGDAQLSDAHKHLSEAMAYIETAQRQQRARAKAAEVLTQHEGIEPVKARQLVDRLLLAMEAEG